MKIKAVFLWIPLIAGLVALFFSPSLYGGFLSWDDNALYVENSMYAGLSFQHWKWMCSTFYLGHWQPLTWLSCALDYKVWKLNASGWHLTNLLIHTLNAVLVYWLCLAFGGRTLGEGISPQRGGRNGVTAGAGCYVAATLAALFWAVHPLRVEAVAWLSTRGYLLCTTFCMLTVLAYLKSGGTQPSGAVEPRSTNRTMYLAALLCFTLATFTKGIGMMLPPVLLLIDWHGAQGVEHGGRSWRWWWKKAVEKIPFFALSMVTGVTAFLAKQTAGGMTSIEEFGLLNRVMLAIYSLWFYVWKIAVPVHLSPLYHRLPEPGIFIPLFLATILLTALALLRRRRHPWILPTTGVYILLVFPMLGITQSGVQTTADRFSYLSALPFSVVFSVALSRVREPFRHSVLMVAGMIVFSLGVLAVNQTVYWKNDLLLWRYTTGLDPLNKDANKNFAPACIDAQQIEEGIAAMQRAVAAAERVGDKDVLSAAYNSMGLIRVARGEYTEALENFARAISIDPQGDGGMQAVCNRASLYFHAGRYQEAAADIDAALKNPKLNDLDRLLRILRRVKIHEAMESRDGLIKDLYETRALNIPAKIQVQAEEQIFSKINGRN